MSAFLRCLVLFLGLVVWRGGVALASESKPAAAKPGGDHGKVTAAPKESAPAKDGAPKGHEKPSPVGEVRKDAHSKPPAAKEAHKEAHKEAGKEGAKEAAKHPEPGAGHGKPADAAKTGDGKASAVKDAPKAGDHKAQSHATQAAKEPAKSAPAVPPIPGAGKDSAQQANAPPVLRPGSYIRSSAERPRAGSRSTGRRRAPNARPRPDSPYVVNVTADLEPEPRTPDEALQLLVKGNQKYLATLPARPESPSASRLPSPKAVVLTCSDSTVAPETLFGLNGGELVCVRVAGAVASKEQTASIAYTFTYADPKVLVVLGHLDCPVARAAVNGDRMPGELAPLLAPLEIAVDKTRYYNPGLRGNDLIMEATRVNVWTSVQDLMRGSDTISRKIRTGALKVVGGVFDFRTGRVNWMGEYPAQLSSGLR